MASNESMEFDGSPSLEQQIEHARVNFPDKLSMYLELTDNSFDHGEATKAGILITNKNIAHIDNGTFPVERRPENGMMSILKTHISQMN